MSSRQALESELARLTKRYEEQPSGRVFAPLADCHRKLGQLDNALQICLTGLARHPRYSSAQLILGKIFLDRGEDVAAREAFETVLELDGQNLLAIQLLADIAERLGEFDEAISRWRQLGSLEFDGDQTEAKLAELQQLKEGPALQDEEEPAREARDVAEPAVPSADVPVLEVEEPEVEPVHEADREPEPQGAPDFSDVTAGDPGQTREIATLTLAGIYAEQGFKAKALEIYSAIAERHPNLPGLRERIDAIESAMAKVERSAVEEHGPDSAADEDGLEVLATAQPRTEDEEAPASKPSEPLFSDVPSRIDPVANDASRYRRFSDWLDRVQSDDED
jgi:tetratricopeptide (TPR) repeat protein